MIEDHTPLSVGEFGGLHSRDSFTDSVPHNHFIDCLNTITEGDELSSRYGFTKSVPLPITIRRVRIYRREGESPRLIILTSNGRFRVFAPGVNVTTILTVASATDFDLEQYYNRAFITPSDGNSGIAGEFVYVYTGSGMARKAAGVKPSSGFNVSASSTDGVVEAGTHIFAWCYETSSGFVTPPGPAVFKLHVANGSKAVDFSNIPVGPPGTAKRRLVASRAIQTYNGNQNGYEMFFVPKGLIDNNSATTLNNVDFYDADLQLSADYTFDQLEEIPAGLFLSKYSDRLCVGNVNISKSLVYVSKKNEPESFNKLAGFLICDPFETEGVKGALEFRDNLYIFKGKPGQTYTTRDNSYEPSTWSLVNIDSGIGADYNCASQFLNESGSNSDFFLVADQGGLYPFNGVYLDPRFALSFKIERIWKRINKKYMNKTQLILDPKKKLIYVLVVLDTATEPTHLLVGDYSNGFDYKRIRWHIWTSDAFNFSSIMVDESQVTGTTYLRIAGQSGDVYDYDEDIRQDDGNAFESRVQFALLYQYPNYVHHFAAMGLRIKGAGDLTINCTAEDGTNSRDSESLTLSEAPGKEYLRILGYEAEKCSVKLGVTAADNYFKIHNMTLYSQPDRQVSG